MTTEITDTGMAPPLLTIIKKLKHMPMLYCVLIMHPQQVE